MTHLYDEPFSESVPDIRWLIRPPVVVKCKALCVRLHCLHEGIMPLMQYPWCNRAADVAAWNSYRRC